jgi:hypothetical protein
MRTQLVQLAWLAYRVARRLGWARVFALSRSAGLANEPVDFLRTKARLRQQRLIKPAQLGEDFTQFLVVPIGEL